MIALLSIAPFMSCVKTPVKEKLYIRRKKEEPKLLSDCRKTTLPPDKNIVLVADS